MKRFYTAESVTEGHPDKLCDLIADSILDECLKEDSSSRAACEVMATKGNLFAAGEITSRQEPGRIQYRRYKDYVQFHRQSLDIVRAVEYSQEKRHGAYEEEAGFINGAGDQSVMVGYACDETPQMVPVPVVLANRIVGDQNFLENEVIFEGTINISRIKSSITEEGIGMETRMRSKEIREDGL